MPNPTHLDTLAQGVGAWNAWRQQNPPVRPDLSGAELAGLELADLNLDHALLTGAVIRDSNLPRLSLRGAEAAGLMLVNVNAPELQAPLAQLGRATFSDVSVPGAIFDEADLSAARLEHLKAPGAFFDACTLSGARLTEADLMNSRFRLCVIEDADLSSARCWFSRFDRCSLLRSNLTEVDLSYSQLIQSTLIGTTLDRAVVHGLTCWGLELDKASQHALRIGQGHSDGGLWVDGLPLACILQHYLHTKEVRTAMPVCDALVVLVIGCWNPHHYGVPGALGELLRARGYHPVYLNALEGELGEEQLAFLGSLARFVIADFSRVTRSFDTLIGVLSQGTVTIQPVLNPEPGRDLSEILPRPGKAQLLTPITFKTAQELLAKGVAHVIVPAERALRSPPPAL